MSFQAHQKGIELFLDIEDSFMEKKEGENQKEGDDEKELEEEDDIIETDPNRLLQVLINLLSNSIKYTVKGYVKAKVTLIPFNKVLIQVIDSGVGIS